MSRRTAAERRALIGAPNAGASDPTVARTRSARDTRTPRVQHIAALMAAGQWYAGRSHVELAREWQTTPDNVAQIAVRAGDLLRHLVDLDPDRLRAQLAATFEDIRRRALERRRPMATRAGVEYVDDPDLNTATLATRHLAELVGLMARGGGNVQVTTQVAIDARQVDTLSPSQASALLKRIRDEWASRRHVQASPIPSQLDPPRETARSTQNPGPHVQQNATQNPERAQNGGGNGMVHHGGMRQVNSAADAGSPEDSIPEEGEGDGSA